MQATDPSLVDPSLFWFWNATPTHQEIDQKLDAFLSKGFRSVYVHPMPQSFRPADFLGGMEVEYLSPEFFGLIAYTCAAMKSRRMTMCLYDEGGWPSGMAGGRVVAENPGYGIWMLDRENGEIHPTQLIAEISYPDLMNPAATECFIRHTHEKYRACIGNEFGKTVRGIFTDEPRLIGRLGTDRIPFSPLLPAAFKSDHGYELDAVLGELFEPAGNNADRQKLHRDYRTSISRLIAQHYYQPIRNWCEKNHLLFEGHHSGEDDYARHGQYFGDFLQQAKQYHIPGVDTIWRQIFPGQSGGNYVQLASSAAWLSGKQVAVSESFAVYGAGLTLEAMKWIAAFQIVRGVNRIGAMASLHSVRGGRRINVCTDISPATPIWRDVDLWSDFVRRASQFTLKGTPQVRVGVFYRGELAPMEKADAFNQAHEAICDRLHDQLINWMFVGVEAIAAGTPSKNGFAVGGMSLSVLVVHVDGALDSQELSAILSVAAAGAKVIVIGADQLETPLQGNRNITLISDVNLLDLQVLATVRTDVTLKGVHLLALKKNDWRGYLFFNQNLHPVQFTFQTQEGCPADWLACVPLEHSALRSCEDRVTSAGLHISLDPGEMRAYQTGDSPRPHTRTASTSTVIELTRNWTVQRESVFLIRDEIQVVEEQSTPLKCILGDFAAHDPAFSGSLIYHSIFHLPSMPQVGSVILDLGTVYYSAEVTCNGKAAGRRAWSPFTFDLSRLIQAGENDLQIRVTNTLANQWASPPVRARDLEEHHNMYLDRVIPFINESLHAGLAGPLVLRIIPLAQESI